MAAAGGSVVSRKKKVSKNKKKSWRKHVDISEVEEHLESERLQHRTGGLVALKTDGELFSLDKDAPEGQVRAKKSAKALSKKKKIQKPAPKPLKCHSNLIPDSKVGKPKVSARLQQALDRRSLKMAKPSAVSERTRARADLAVVRSNQKLFDEEKFADSYDLWGSPVETELKNPVKPPKHHLKKPSELPSVLPPHSGASYNPTFEDHQDLLRKANEVEERKLEKERKIQRQYEKHFPSQLPPQSVWLEEMSAGLSIGNKEEVDHLSNQEDDSNDEEIVRPAPVDRDDKKSRKQRRKEKEQKQIKVEAREKKRDRARVNRFSDLKSVKRAIASEERALKEKADRKARYAAGSLKRTARLGRHRYEEPDLELNLTEELGGSLRQLRPDGNLLHDRYKSLQRRNMIEPGGKPDKVKGFRHKPREVLKRSHRLDEDWW